MDQTDFIPLIDAIKQLTKEIFLHRKALDHHTDAINRSTNFA